MAKSRRRRTRRSVRETSNRRWRASTTPERIIADGDDVVVITKITAGDESALQADVLTYRNGLVVKAVSIADTELQARVYGTK